MKWKTIIILIILFQAVNVIAFRISRPPTLSYPLDQNQINQLNFYLENLWNLQNGEFNFDIVTTSKTSANNGDLWILQTGVISQIQWKANDTIYTIHP